MAVSCLSSGFHAMEPMLAVAEGAGEEGGERAPEETCGESGEVGGATIVLLGDGRVQLLDKSLVVGEVRGVEDGVAVVPLVPSGVPKGSDESRYPAIGGKVAIMEKALAIESLSGPPVMREEPPKGVLPANGRLGRECLAQDRVSAVALGRRSAVPRV